MPREMRRPVRPAQTDFRWFRMPTGLPIMAEVLDFASSVRTRRTFREARPQALA